ncbi:hypothetical protein ACP70R_029629 [Stipagrostis hirtigluma subsp. patula]
MAGSGRADAGAAAAGVGAAGRQRHVPDQQVAADTTFCLRDGVLEIPAVESCTHRAIFANLLAYEQSRGG